MQILKWPGNSLLFRLFGCSPPARILLTPRAARYIDTKHSLHELLVRGPLPRTPCLLS